MTDDPPWSQLARQAKSLGYELPHNWPTDAFSSVVAPMDEYVLREIGAGDPARRSGVALATVCTLNYIHFAKTLVSSALAQNPDLEPFVLLLDWDGEEPVDVPGAQVLAGRQIGIDRFGFLALKFDAIELCCAAKPYLLQYLAQNERHSKILYFDSDIYVFAPLERMLERLEEYDFVVTPHTLAPLPDPQRFRLRPTLGDLAAAGVFNAGMFGLSVGPAACDFLETWRRMVSAPGAFLKELGLQHEQNHFNWISCFADRVHVLRDPAYNVAYWNLHDRSLRCTALDNGKSGWTVNGKPLVTYHFSGFSLAEPYNLSKHDNRSSLYLLPSVAHLFDFYRQKLREAGGSSHESRDYGFDRLPNGTPISSEMRNVFKKYESFLWRPLDPFTEEGCEYFCRALFLPVPSSRSFLPILLKELYDQRPDLQELSPNADLKPQTMIDWYSRWGAQEQNLEEFFYTYAPLTPKHEAVSLLADLREEKPHLFRGLESPLTKDRPLLLRRLVGAHLEKHATSIGNLSYEFYALSPVSLVRHLLEERAHLREAFPDPLGQDSHDLSRWLAHYGVKEHFLSPQVAKVFAQKASGKSLARIFSFVNRTWVIMKQWPLALVGVDKESFAQVLLDITRDSPEYDADDILMYLWLMDESPWVGLPLTLELAVNSRRTPSPLLNEGQEELLEPVLRDARFRRELATYRQRFDTPRRRHEIQHIRNSQPSVFVLDNLRSTTRASCSSRTQDKGANVFGYFKSPVGLGSLSRGLSLALNSIDLRVAENVIGNVAMDKDLSPEDFLRTYDHRLGINIFASYPHLHENILDYYPPHVTKDRLNVIYLAWEQRDGSPYWPSVYSDFQQVWALSEFAAKSLRRHMKRDVITVPCVVDYSSFPDAATKEDVGLAEDRFVFLYVFDANSSIERKNPEAAIEAFRRAFRSDDRVQLLIRVSNSHRLEHRERLALLVNAARQTGLDVTFRFQNMSHNALLRLISSVDCYVSLHRAEGFGYTCAEAMGYGVPVIATNYSGNLEFMDDSNSFLVDYVEQEVTVPDGPFQRGSIWAEPSVDHAAELMRRVFLERDHASETAARGRDSVQRLLSPRNVGRIVSCALLEDKHDASRAPTSIHS